MEEDNVIHKQVVSLKGHPTSSVTIYPNRAAILRELKDITIKPGLNEIHIHHVTPVAEDNSVQVLGTCTSSHDSDTIRITGTTIDRVLHPVLFNYQKFRPYESSTDDEGENETDEREISTIKQNVLQLKGKLSRYQDRKATTMAQAKMLEEYGKTLASSPEVLVTLASSPEVQVQSISSFLELYAEKTFELSEQYSEVQSAIEKLQEEHDKAVKKGDKRWNALQRKKMERKQKRQRARREQEFVKSTDDVESEEFNTGWKRIVVTIEGPQQTGEGCHEIKMDLSLKYVLEIQSNNLFGSSLGFQAQFAGWKPSYHITVDTIDPQASMLAYKAIFWNFSQETWKNARITLSASQTTASERSSVTAPVLEPWKLSLTKAGKQNLEQAKKKEMYSNQERVWKKTGPPLHSGKPPLERQPLGHIPQPPHIPVPGSLFGASNNSTNATGSLFGSRLGLDSTAAGGLFGSTSSTAAFGVAPPQPQQYNSLQQVQQQQQQMLRQVQQQQQQMQQQQMQQQQMQPQQMQQQQMQQQQMQPQQMQQQQMQQHVQLQQQLQQRLQHSTERSEPEDHDEDDEDDDTLSDTETISTLSAVNSIQASKSYTTSRGQTTTHVLSQLMTIPPRSGLAQHGNRTENINPSIPLTQIELSYITVPKLSPVAYLRAKIRNTSNLVWLKGQAGLTLDGSYLGSNLTMPKCEIGQLISLTLGVDESVKVVYGKVARKKGKQNIYVGNAVSAVFGGGKKEEWDREVYERAIDVWNLKNIHTPDHKGAGGSAAGKGKIVIEVIDQIPVSEHENLQIKLRNPVIPTQLSTVATGSGNSTTGSTSFGTGPTVSTEVATGTPLGEIKKGEVWGSAKARVYWKTGIIIWRVELQPGKGVRLGLEYEVRCPVGEVAVGA